jgi:hypothetical protein
MMPRYAIIAGCLLLALNLIIVPYNSGNEPKGYNTIFNPIKDGYVICSVDYDRIFLQSGAIVLVAGAAALCLRTNKKSHA